MQTIEEMSAMAATQVSEARSMRAITHRHYGGPEVLVCEEVQRPAPGEDEVLIRVHAAGVSIGDHHIVTGKPYLVRLSPFGGFPRPRNTVPGAAMSGRVEAVGAKVTAFRVGDEVFGQALHGAFAEYLVMPAVLIALKPKNLSFEEAAAVPWGTTALQGLRDAGGLRAGERVLINGASGAVGTWAVQIAKALGAHVTAVCSTRNIEMVRGLGADVVIDYTKEDFAKDGARFDVLMDMVGNRALKHCKRVLVPGGRYVPCAAGAGDWVGPIVWILRALLAFAFTKLHFRMYVQKLAAEDLIAMRTWIEAGKMRPVVERTYALAEASEALRHVGEGHTRGLTVLRIGAGAADL